MEDRFKFRIPMFTDKDHFSEYQYIELGDTIECTLCGHNGEPQQSTGLKDKNGKLIFEGDIIKYEWYTQGFAPHIWRDDKKTVNDIRKDYVWLNNYLTDGKHRDVEIIGNIYENPDLLAK